MSGVDLEPPVLKPAAKYGLAGEVVDALHPYNEGDEATILTEYLTLFGGFLGLKPHFNVGKTRHYGRLFMAVVGQSGSSRKGSTFNLVRSVFEEIDADFLRLNVRKNVGSDRGILSAAAHSLEYAENTGHDDARLLIVENEFSSLLAGGTLQRVSPMIRDAWDTNVLMSSVKRSIHVEPLHLSIIGMITLDELRGLLTHNRVQAQVSNGLFNRFLVVVAQESKQLRLDQMEVPELTLTKLANKTRTALDNGRAVYRTVPIDKGVVDAQFKWRQKMKKRREREVKKAKIAARMFDLLNRGETYLLRLSFLYAMLDGSPRVRMDHYLAAEALWDYIEGSVRYVFEIPEFSPQAKRLIDALEQAGPMGLPATKLHNVLSRNQYSKDAIQELVDAGVIQSVEVRQAKSRPGRPRQMYRLTEFADIDVDLSLKN